MARRTFRSVSSDDGYEPSPEEVPEVSPQERPRRGRAARVPAEPAPDAVLPSHGLRLSDSFWGQAWNRHLMAYADGAGRMPRGRTLFRQGAVSALRVEAGVVTSQVLDRDGETYAVRVAVRPLDDAEKASLRDRCVGRVEGLSELLGGELGDDVMRAVTDPATGLFPQPGAVRFSCTCLDPADLCAHQAATLYAVGSMLDRQPGLLFTLRGMDPRLLVETDLNDAITRLTTPSSPAGNDRQAALDGVDLGEMFGLGE